MNGDDLRQRAAVVRAIMPETVLIVRGAVRDRQDKSKWHTEQGPLSVTGPKFRNWQRGTGGGGAIDLVMHLANVDFRTAIAWLEQHLGAGHLAVDQARTRSHPSLKKPPAPEGQHTLRLPMRDDRMLDRVRHYLTRCRHLAASLLEPLLQSGTLYADSRANAVFLMVVGKANRPVGAELRGTGPRVWRGMAWDGPWYPQRPGILLGRCHGFEGNSCSANQPSMRSVASRCIRLASASRLRAFEPIPDGSPR